MLDELLMGRNERNINSSIFAQNIFDKDGLFRSLANVVRSDSYLFSATLKADLPIAKLPLQVYAQGVLYPNTVDSDKNVNFGFTSGVSISLFNENIEVYFPIYTNKSISESYILKDLKYKQKIMFKINLQNMNIYNAAKDIERFL